MKLESIKIKNFRGYTKTTKINFGGLTLFVGKNDVGKSTILEAADIFFNNKKPDGDDLSIYCTEENAKIEISAELSEYPKSIDLDAGATTSLEEEFLLNDTGNLEIKKIYTPGSSAKPKVILVANMPTGFDALITLKNQELKSKAIELGIDTSEYDARINNSIRKAIWRSINITEKEVVEIDINKEDGKELYEKLELAFPVFSLFSVDRKNTDQDKEIQNPLNSSIKEVLNSLQEKLEPIQQAVEKELSSIVEGTIEKIKDMNPEVANTLKANIENPAWDKAFSITMDSDNIPLNKHGSGVKRLILINFFRHEAERRCKSENRNSVLYAIEEPEASQHPDWQIKLFEAFKDLAISGNAQIALTSHHPELCGLVDLKDTRLIKKHDNDVNVFEGNDTTYKEIIKTLGIVPRLDGVKVIVGLEGPNDITFLHNIAHVFGIDVSSEKILWLPLGGNTLKQYAEKEYLKNLNLPQIYKFDRDGDSKYKDTIEELKQKGHWAELTTMLSIENYLHPRIYKEIWPTLTTEFVDADNSSWLTDWSDKNIPDDLYEFIREQYETTTDNSIRRYSKTNIKDSFAEFAVKMTKEDFDEMGTFNELDNLFTEIKKYL